MQSDISKLKIIADAGDSDAAFAIFDACENTKTNPDVLWDVALHYLNLATEKENPDALLAMGRLLIAGTKIDKDVEKGMALLQRAKELGNKDVDVASALEIELYELDHDQAEHDNSQLETEDADASDKADAQSADNSDVPDDDDSCDDDYDDDDDDDDDFPISFLISFPNLFSNPGIQ